MALRFQRLASTWARVGLWCLPRASHAYISCTCNPNVVQRARIVYFNGAKCNNVHHLTRRLLSSYPDHNVIKLPNLSPTMETGTVVSWAKNEGDEVSEGDLLAEIETDKATMSFEASDSGFLARILAPAGTKDIPVGSPLCVMVTDAESVSAFKDYVAPETSTPSKAPAPPQAKKASPDPPPASAASPAPPSPQAVTPVTSQPPGSRVFVSPLARKLAAEQGIDVNRLSGSGTGIRGMFRASDLSGAQLSAAQTAVGGFTDAMLSGPRSAAAKQATQSQLSIPHYYLTMDIEVDELFNVRDQVNTTLAKRAGKDQPVSTITLTDLLIKAVSVACRKVPECNSSWQGDSIRQYNTVDVNVVVPTPEGVLSPIVFGAETKGLLQISEEVTGLINKAKENKLQPQESQTGTFTLSNLGMFGVSSFSAIINPPQACLLAVGRAQKLLLPDASSATGFAAKHVMSCTLCCDHRVVDGAVGAMWLAEFKSILETPALMLV